MNSISIYTDGASRGNPGPGGWGVVVTLEGKTTELGGRDAHTTNNRMELTAAIKALQFFGNDKLFVYSDSSYVVKGMTEWIHNWQKRGWKTAAKKPVENQDLWQELLAASAGKDISWVQVAGHADNRGNNRADEIATAFADGITIQLRREYVR